MHRVQVIRTEGLIYMVLEYGDIDLARLLAKHEKVIIIMNVSDIFIFINKINKILSSKSQSQSISTHWGAPSFRLGAG